MGLQRSPLPLLSLLCSICRSKGERERASKKLGGEGGGKDKESFLCLLFLLHVSPCYFLEGKGRGRKRHIQMYLTKDKSNKGHGQN
jgi:hypothetical protein